MRATGIPNAVLSCGMSPMAARVLCVGRRYSASGVQRMQDPFWPVEGKTVTLDSLFLLSQSINQKMGLPHGFRNSVSTPTLEDDPNGFCESYAIPGRDKDWFDIRPRAENCADGFPRMQKR